MKKGPKDAWDICYESNKIITPFAFCEKEVQVIDVVKHLINTKYVDRIIIKRQELPESWQ